MATVEGWPVGGPSKGRLVPAETAAEGSPPSTDPSCDPLRGAICASVHDLYTHDLDLLGTTKRVVVGRLMIYLNRHLTGLSLNGLVLDQDYERAGQATKRLIGAGLRAAAAIES
ncbi:hypothetical protein GCM10028790_20080 [Micromonospora taraxaci]